MSRHIILHEEIDVYDIKDYMEGGEFSLSLYGLDDEKYIYYVDKREGKIEIYEIIS